MIVHFSAHISKWELVCKFGVIFHIYYFLPLFTVSCTKPVIFLLCNNLFIYQVLCTLIYRRRSLYSFLFVLWTIPFVPISHRISMRMFSYITLCKYTYHSSICLLAIILSIQSFQSTYNHTGHVPLSPVRIVYYISNYLFLLYGKFAYLTNELWEICH